jgi:sucrose-6-phosphate hydrolase SacC (GH32 family)
MHTITKKRLRAALGGAVLALLAGCGGGASAAGAADAPAGGGALLMHLPLAEGQGSAAGDAARDGAMAAILSAQQGARFGQRMDPAWKSSACIAANCLRFDGYSTRIQLPALPENALASGFTVSAWVAPFAFEFGDSVPQPRLSALVSQFDAGAKRGLVFGLYRHGTWGVSLGSGDLVYEIKATEAPHRVNRNEWTHIAFTYDAASNRFALLRNGVQVSGGKLPAGTRVLLPATIMSIGRHSQPDKVVGVFKFNSYSGLANHLRLHGAAMDAEAIRNQMQADLAARGGQAPAVSFDDIDQGPLYLSSDRHRPGFHALPNFGWMNEPHAPFFYKGAYHLFFQKNPFGPFWHQIHWGHWVSDDMVSWREIDMALAPTDNGEVTRDIRPTAPAYAGTVAPDGMWSGSATFDRNGNPVLFMTAGNDSKVPAQAVGLAIPADLNDPQLRNWKIFPKTVIEWSSGQGLRDHFRDPFVFHDKTVDKYFALITSGTSRSGTALVYESANLIDWTPRGPLYDIDGSKYPQAGAVWELPVFLPVGKDASGKEKWALLINSHGAGSVLDVYYWIGQWDPRSARFISDQEAPRVFDKGQGAFTGPSGFIDPKSGRAIVFSIAQGERAPQLDFDSGWAHTGGTPIELSLGADGNLRVKPIAEVARLRSKTLVELRNVSLAEANGALAQVRGDMLDIEVEFETTSAAGVRVRAHPQGLEQTDLRVDPGVRQFFADRSKATIDSDQRGIDRKGGEVTLGDGAMTLRVLVDRSLIEAYLNDQYSLTTRSYPGLKDSEGVALIGDPGLRIKRIAVHAMKHLAGAQAKQPTQGQFNTDPRSFFSSDLPNGSFQNCNLSGWTVKSGSAFSNGTVSTRTKSLDTGVFFNQSQRSRDACLLWGFAAGDGAVGEMESVPFVLGGDGGINFLIGGGDNIEQLYIALVRASDGKELFRATGTDWDEMVRVHWDARAFIGERLFLRVVDKATGSGGHLNLDDINVTFQK